MKKINHNYKCWALLLCLLVWLPINSLAQTEQFEMVVEKVDGTQLTFLITDDYPVLQYHYGGEKGVNTLKIQTGKGTKSVPCPEIKCLFTRVCGNTSYPETFVSGGDENKEEDDAATYQVTTESEGNPTVAITDDTNVTGEFAIPESVTNNGTTYTVTEIAVGTFENNTNLTDVTIPSTIKSIGDKAFAGCSNLKTITVNIETPIDLSGANTHKTRGDGSSVFEGVDKETCILYVPENGVELYKTVAVWKDFKNILAIISSGINGIIISNGKLYDVYDLRGQKVKERAANFNDLPKGIYIANGKKLVLK